MWIKISTSSDRTKRPASFRLLIETASVIVVFTMMITGLLQSIQQSSLWSKHTLIAGDGQQEQTLSSFPFTSMIPSASGSTSPDMIDDTVSARCGSSPLQPSTNFTPMFWWVGEQWHPSSNVHLFTPREMRLLLSRENTLWIGDSTARQDYVTMHNLMSASNWRDIPLVEVQDGINVNKERITEPCLLKQNLTDFDLVFCRHLADSNFTSNSTNLPDVGAYDFIRRNCFTDVAFLLNSTHQRLLNDYSTIVFSLGVWDSVRPWDCGRRDAEYVTELLDLIQEKLAAKNQHLQIIWKLHAGAGNEQAGQRGMTAAVQGHVRAWFAAATSRHNIHLVDFAGELKERTYGNARLHGDLAPHVGPAARTLVSQMVTQELFQSRMCQNAIR